MRPSLCKVCLAWNRRTQVIGNIKLREIFEKLTNLQVCTYLFRLFYKIELPHARGIIIGIVQAPRRISAESC